MRKRQKMKTKKQEKEVEKGNEKEQEKGAATSWDQVVRET